MSPVLMTALVLAIFFAPLAAKVVVWLPSFKHQIKLAWSLLAIVPCSYSSLFIFS